MKSYILLGLLLILGSACVNRTDAISRGMEWVDAHVPYDASSYHKGYIQGCQGIVGYAWLFPKPGIYSGDLISQGYCKKTTKDHMEAGDIMVCPGTHQLLFHSWAKSDKSQYWAIELGGPRGSIKYVIPWPYHSTLNPGCYIPCKVEKACLSDSQSHIQTE